MPIFNSLESMGHEQVVFNYDTATGYRGIIAIHSTKLGPAVGGTRLWLYADEEDALIDALRLSRGMTYKCAVADMPFGGGKAVIIGDGKTLAREKIFRAHGRFVEQLGGRYITAEDVGTSPADMDDVRLETKHVAGLRTRSGDPSPWTAHGVFRAMQAAAKFRWHTDELAGKTVALQGCGHVGYFLAQELNAAGAKLFASDVDPARVQRIVAEFGATAVEPEAIYRTPAQIFAPCALGAIINDRTLPQLQAEMIVGAANNQLHEPRHGEALAQRDILYIPDYVANAGGVINGGIEMLGWTPEQAQQKVHAIYDTVREILAITQTSNLLPHQAADQMAERRLANQTR